MGRDRDLIPVDLGGQIKANTMAKSINTCVRSFNPTGNVALMGLLASLAWVIQSLPENERRAMVKRTKNTLDYILEHGKPDNQQEIDHVH